VLPGVTAFHPGLGERYLFAEHASALLFTDNETNTQRLSGTANPTPYVKDGINQFVVHGWQHAINPAQQGTKAAAQYPLTIAAGGSATVRLRLCDLASATSHRHGPFGASFDAILEARRQEADAFYARVIPSSLGADATNVMRQALAGMLWSKQFYYYDVDRWLEEHGSDPFTRHREGARNERWHHMFNARHLDARQVGHLGGTPRGIGVPDRVEHGRSRLRQAAARSHAGGAVSPSERPAARVQWNFGDVNPPVHAWSAIFTYASTRPGATRPMSTAQRIFHKLLINFTWWSEGPQRQRLRALPRPRQHRRVRSARRCRPASRAGRRARRGWRSSA
jgi:hypothetical protein